MLVQRPGLGGMSRPYHLSRLNHKQQTWGLKLETLQGFKYMTGRFELPIEMEGSLRGTTRRSEALIVNSNRTSQWFHLERVLTPPFWKHGHPLDLPRTPGPAKVESEDLYYWSFHQKEKSLINCYRVAYEHNSSPPKFSLLRWLSSGSSTTFGKELLGDKKRSKYSLVPYPPPQKQRNCCWKLGPDLTWFEKFSSRLKRVFWFQLVLGWCGQLIRIIPEPGWISLDAERCLNVFQLSFWKWRRLQTKRPCSTGQSSPRNGRIQTIHVGLVKGKRSSGKREHHEHPSK